MEQLGAEGNVEESQKVMDEVEKARAKKREAEVTESYWWHGESLSTCTSSRAYI